MGASQKYTEEIEKRLEDNYYHYELEESVLQELEDMPSEYSIPIAIMLEDNVNTLPIIDEYTQILGGVLKLDYMLEEQILKSNEPILQRIYKSKSS